MARGAHKDCCGGEGRPAVLGLLAGAGPAAAAAVGHGYQQPARAAARIPQMGQPGTA